MTPTDKVTVTITRDHRVVIDGEGIPNLPYTIPTLGERDGKTAIQCEFLGDETYKPLVVLLDNVRVASTTPVQFVFEGTLNSMIILCDDDPCTCNHDATDKHAEFIQTLRRKV